MDIVFCEVDGCSSPANGFLSDDRVNSERRCSYHWARLRRAAAGHSEKLDLAELNFVHRQADQAPEPNPPTA
jgi:hypothetical protein